MHKVSTYIEKAYILTLAYASISGFQLCAIPGVGYAQHASIIENISPSKFMLRQLSTRDGLPANYLRYVFQSESGYVWIGSPHGLSRYDGTEVYTFSRENTPGWKGINEVSLICEDKDEAIWVNGGDHRESWIYVLDQPNVSDSVSLVTVGNYVKLSCLPNKKIAYVDKSRLTIASELRSKKSVELPKAFKGELGYGFFVTGEDEYWVSTENKVALYKDGRFCYETKIEENVMEIIRSEEGNILLSSENSIYVFRDSTFEKVRQFDVDVNWTSSYNSNAFWANLSDGVYRITESEAVKFPYVNEGTTYREQLNLFEIGGVQYATWNMSSLEGRLLQKQDDDSWKSIGLEQYGVKVVNWISNDREGGFWVTTDVGLFHLVPRKMEVYTQNEGLADWQVFALDSDQDHGVWISVWGDGVQRLEGGRLTQYTESEGLPSNYVLSFFSEEDGSMLIGTNRGIALITEGRVVESFPYEKATTIAEPYMKDLHRDRKGRLWVATGVNLFNFKQGVYHPVWPGSNVNTISLLEDRQGTMWAGTRKGLYFEESPGNWRRFPDPQLEFSIVQDISEDDLGNLWFSLEQGGLVRGGVNGYFSYTAQHGLPTNKIQFSLADDYGYLWVGTDRGLVRIPYASLDDVYFQKADKLKDLIIISEEDGLPSAELVAGSSSAFKADDGRLWFATTGGIAVVDPVNMSQNTYVPRVHIQGFYVQGDRKEINNNQAFLTGPRNTFTFHFATLSFRVSSRNNYKYRLKGISDIWQTTYRNELSFSGLGPGKYIFEVFGSNSDGIWSKEPAQVSFTVLPVFYQTVWFWICVFIILVAFGTIWYRHILYKNALRIALIRNRIADDLHDDIGSKISAIAQTLGFMRDKAKLDKKDLQVLSRQVDITNELIDDLRDSVWIVDTEKDTLEHLVDRMEAFANHINFGREIHLQRPAGLPHREINMEWRRNVYLLYKEGLNNALRHNINPEVKVEITFTRDTFFFEISDNGTGFDVGRIRMGRGMHTMQRRVEDLGAELKLDSKPGEGTVMRFSCHMP